METIKGIIAEMRKDIPRVVDAKVILNNYADRIEAATTNCNQLEMREALVQCELFLGNVSRHAHPLLNPGDKCTACDGGDELRGMVFRALSTPPRNCDVSTAEEQSSRFLQFCNSNPISCKGCPCKNMDAECRLAWAQMPYEKGNNNDK